MRGGARGVVSIWWKATSFGATYLIISLPNDGLGNQIPGTSLHRVNREFGRRIIWSDAGREGIESPGRFVYSKFAFLLGGIPLRTTVNSVRFLAKKIPPFRRRPS